jgi:putative addiction module component (TIGR02574 family)
MDAVAEKILQEALALSAESRAELVDSLLGSLDGEMDQVVDEAWRAEVRKRVAEIESGEVETVSWEDFEARMRSHP